jgi:hypothetical protein
MFGAEGCSNVFSPAMGKKPQKFDKYGFSQALQQPIKPVQPFNKPKQRED